MQYNFSLYFIQYLMISSCLDQHINKLIREMLHQKLNLLRCYILLPLLIFVISVFISPLSSNLIRVLRLETMEKKVSVSVNNW